jgi:hypothetical protein
MLEGPADATMRSASQRTKKQTAGGGDDGDEQHGAGHAALVMGCSASCPNRSNSAASHVEGLLEC